MRYLSTFEERLVELVHLLSYGTPEEHGLTVQQVKQMLLKALPHNSRVSVLESLENNDKIIDELREFLSR